MNEEFEHDGHTYQIHKLSLSDGKDVTTKLIQGGLETLLSDRSELDWLERKLFGQHCQLLNDAGEWVPLGKALTEKHFEGRTESYMEVLMEAFRYNFQSFLAGGWITSLMAAGEEIEAE